MTTREEVTWLCDLCVKPADVETHEVTVNGVTVELEACARCWSKPTAVFDKLAAAGRVTGRKKRARAR